MLSIIKLILFSTAGWFIYNKKSETRVIQTVTEGSAADSKSMTPAQINKSNEAKVVFFEIGRKLELTPTGDPLYHVYLPQTSAGGFRYIAAYIRNSSGGIEPLPATKSAAPEGSIKGYVKYFFPLYL